MPVRLLAREIDRHRIPAEVSVVPDARFVAELDGLVTPGGDGTMLGGMRLVIDRPVPVLGVNLAIWVSSSRWPRISCRRR